MCFLPLVAVCSMDRKARTAKFLLSGEFKIEKHYVAKTQQ